MAIRTTSSRCHWSLGRGRRRRMAVALLMRCTQITRGKGRGAVPRERVMLQQGTPKRGVRRTEPEILLPNRRFARPERGSGIRVFVIGRGGQRTYFAKPGPFSALVATIVLGALLVVSLVFALSVLLIAALVVG